MRVFQLFLKIRIFSTLPGLAIGRKPEFSAVFHSNTTTNEEYIYIADIVRDCESIQPETMLFSK
jgi:hypothetical protein